MQALTATRLLGAWEEGARQSPTRRALTLLALAVDSGGSVEELAALSIGRRDAELLTLRERAFGAHVNGLATCPGCGLHVQLDFAVSDVRVAAPAEAIGPHLFRVEDCEVTFRLPDSHDLAALAVRGDVAPTGRALLERCLVSARRDGRDVPADELPDAVVAAISRDMDAADPQACVRLALECPECRASWEAPLDIASFLWSEIDAWAFRLLSEVHALARAYAWREADILAMSSWRRQAYLELVGQ